MSWVGVEQCIRFATLTVLAPVPTLVLAFFVVILSHFNQIMGETGDPESSVCRLALGSFEFTHNLAFLFEIRIFMCSVPITST